MLAFRVVFIQGIYNGLQVLLVGEEIGIGSINKKGLQVVLLDVMGVGFLYREQVVVRDVELVRAVALPDVLLQLAHRGMQVNDQFGLHQLRQDDIKEALVKAELIIRQVYFGKKQAFGEEVVGDGNTLEQVLLLDQFLQLLEALRHKEQLEGEGVLPWVLVELREKRVIGKLL